MLKSDKERYPELVKEIEAIEQGIKESKNKSFIQKLKNLAKLQEDKKPQIEVNKYCLFEWWIIRGSNKKPYLCGMSCAGCGNISFVIDYKLNILKDYFYGNLHRDNENDYKQMVEYIIKYE